MLPHKRTDHNVIEFLSLKCFINPHLQVEESHFLYRTPHRQRAMASHHRKAESAADHEQDLATILTTEERVDLTLLITNITELMRKQITDNFDASITSA